MALESDKMREYFGREVYFEIEKRMLRTVLKKPTLTRWKLLCEVMADGVSIAANECDRNLASRGWLCLGALHLQTLPMRTKKGSHLPLHEYSCNEIDILVNAFLPLAKSLKYYLDKVYRGFDGKTGKWGRAGKVDKVEAPLPFFIDKWLNSGQELICECADCIFDTQVDTSVDDGMVYRFSGDFFHELAMISDDEDAELWIVGDFAANTEVGEIKEALSELAGHKRKSIGKRSSGNLNKVFVVHGHNESLLSNVKRFLLEHSLRPIILKDEPSIGRTIIEKFEFYSHVDYAVILLTADDIGYAKDCPKMKERRGRQNVILEMGYFMGKYGRGRMVVLCDEDVSHPSDVDGLVYIDMGCEDWEQLLVRELCAAGLVVSENHE